MKCVIPACYRGVRLHIWSGNHNAVPGRTGRTPMPETSNQLPPATCVCAGSDDDGLGGRKPMAETRKKVRAARCVWAGWDDDGLGDRQAPGGVDTPDDSQAGVGSSSERAHECGCVATQSTSGSTTPTSTTVSCVSTYPARTNNTAKLSGPIPSPCLLTHDGL